MVKFKKVLKISKGDIFGELALISNKKRAATITCYSDCHFAVLDRDSFQVIMNQHEFMIDQRVNYIKHVPFLQDISRTALMKYSHYFTEKEFKMG